MAEHRCPRCDHIFTLAEILDEWCAECGKRIPEVLLKEARPKPHLRHPHPLPPPSVETQLEQSRDNALRLGGLLLMLAGLIIGLVSWGWGIYQKFSLGEVSMTAYLGGGVALVALVAGIVLMNRSESSES
ncbi:MAG: hypothetical protein RMJ56_02715 [Gemmataceae bacterium]|nr:hypothetical protein [Gemmata sp.]MDW8196499.1 hypothetical protein [Gemmataceae bacterium]